MTPKRLRLGSECTSGRRAQDSKRRVEVGRAVNGLQLITAGLQKDDVVVVEGMQKAGEGKTVKVLQAAAQSAGNTSEQPSN